mmetsp:Transcript_8371/g.10909  ORF Transcript_8371/g.10909 Transcript_8371/m.10909 type:complete len:200 (-) Transcript_8371:1598-2197(-)
MEPKTAKTARETIAPAFSNVLTTMASTLSQFELLGEPHQGIKDLQATLSHLNNTIETVRKKVPEASEPITNPSNHSVHTSPIDSTTNRELFKETKSESPAEKDETKENPSLYIVNLDSILPRKFKSKENFRRLELVWQCVYFKAEDGSTLSDIVKVCGCSVLQANDCLSFLIKNKIIMRRKFRHGIRYFLDANTLKQHS